MLYKGWEVNSQNEKKEMVSVSNTNFCIKHHI